MSGQWHYSGDVNLEYGGMWYRLDGWEDGYFDVVRVDPCSDAGGPENVFWVHALTGIVPRNDAELASCLSTIGAELDGLSESQKRRVIAEAVVAYGLYDPANCYPQNDTETVQIGAKADAFRPEHDLVHPTVTLRGNASLKRYVWREFLNGRA